MAFISIAHRLLRNYLHYPIIFLREAPPAFFVCRPNLRFNNTTDL
jgi:hypothetical protein